MPSEMARLKRYLQTAEDIEGLAPELQTKITGIGPWRRIREFVLAEGSEFIIQPFPCDYRQRPHGECFIQSILLSINAELTYIEGYAIPPNGVTALHHAWCEGPESRVIDCTWENNGLAYFGIRFRDDYVNSRFNAFRNDVYPRNKKSSLLDDPNNDWAILNGQATDWRLE